MVTDPKVLLRRARQLIGVLAAVLLISSLTAAGAGADTISQKRIEAERLASQLEAQNERVGVLAERVDAARIKAEQVGGSLATAEAKLADATQASDAARSRLRNLAIDAYVRGGMSPPAASAVTANEDPSVRQGYIDQLTSGHNEALDAMRAAKLSLGEQRAALLSARQQATQALASVASAERAASQAEAQVRASLAKAKGELGQLVAAEQARREAADRARATSALRASRSRASFGPAPPVGRGASFAVEAARAQLDKPYQWGGSGPGTFDCSGLTMFAWHYGGVSLSHSAAAQYSETAHISLADIQPGDLLFYGSPISHVGIYVGGGQMIHAPHTGDVVRYTSINHGGMPVGIGRPG
jgi:cell wall-associated NlpC family hydrolase